LAQSRGEPCHKQSLSPSQTPVCFWPASDSPQTPSLPCPAAVWRPARSRIKSSSI
jgi:hypothetical protein